MLVPWISLCFRWQSGTLILKRVCDTPPAVLEVVPANHSRPLVDMGGRSADVDHLGPPDYESWPMCSFALSSSCLHPLCKIIFLILHILHLHSPHATHPCAAFMANLAKFNSSLFVFVSFGCQRSSDFSITYTWTP